MILPKAPGETRAKPYKNMGQRGSKLSIKSTDTVINGVRLNEIRAVSGCGGEKALPQTEEENRRQGRGGQQGETKPPEGRPYRQKSSKEKTALPTGKSGFVLRGGKDSQPRQLDRKDGPASTDGRGRVQLTSTVRTSERW